MRDTPAARAWAVSGAMALTGRPDGPPLVAPDGIVERIRALGAPIGVDALALAVERAALTGLIRRGDTGCGGSARLVRARDGWVACNLARPDDVATIPAWLGPDVAPNVDAALGAIATRDVATLIDGAALLGLPVAAVGEVATREGPVERMRAGDAAPLDRRPLVVDFSSLWAGPLCARLLAANGARVVKVESTGRPDGARHGSPAFFDAMQQHAECVAVDMTSRHGRAALLALVRRADVVIEASRPRALRQLGLDASALLRDGPRVWVSITGYGRGSNRVGFGDDAAAAGGLVARDGRGPMFVADAIADPCTGVAAAAATLACLQEGGRWLLDAAMARVAAHVAGADRDAIWEAGDPCEARPPVATTPAGHAPALGAHNAAIATEFGITW
jgi:crotonobetainyl-CoA:carnitine CoA-transferase CaiB-like acyl-CoA transferase